MYFMTFIEEINFKVNSYDFRYVHSLLILKIICMNDFSRPACKTNNQKRKTINPRHRSLYALFLRTCFISKTKPKQTKPNFKNNKKNQFKLQFRLSKAFVASVSRKKRG